LIRKHVKRKPGIQLRVVQTATLQLAVLIVLYEVVIGIARKREWI
jgi:hypothetical protein